jgi:glycosyltransferase involved in cell wall biosynthesis
MNKRFNLAIVVGQLGLGGAEQQLYHFLSGLDSSRFCPLVITLGPRPDEYWRGPLEELGVPVQHVNRQFSRVFRAIRIAAILRAEKIQIVHSWSFHTNPYAALAGRLASVPLRLGSMRENYSLLTERLVRRVGYFGLDALTTNSRSAALQVKEFGLTSAPVRFISNGVHIPDRVNQADRLRLKRELGFSDSEILIGNIARLDGNKNQAMLLRAFASLTEKWSDLRLVIIGDGPLKCQLAETAQDLGIASKVSIPGSIPQAARYLSAMDVCCMTSYTEGLPNLVMEAMAAGLPVVSTSCGDCADLIEHGVSGYLISVNDDGGLTAHLELLMTHPELRLRMGHAGREKMRREYSVEGMVGRMVQFYEYLLAGKRLLSVRGSKEATPL